jgi:hypothetical protein
MMELRIADVTEVGTKDNGDQIVLGGPTTDGGSYRIAIPSALYQGVLASMFAAASMSFREQLRRLGSEEAVVNAFGVAEFSPTGYKVFLGRDDSADSDVILLQLKKDHAPIVNVMWTPQEAQQVANALLASVAQGPLPPMGPESRQ